jgi:hypothetical protein
MLLYSFIATVAKPFTMAHVLVVDISTVRHDFTLHFDFSMMDEVFFPNVFIF